MKKLFIDYEVCHNCPECTARCSYLHHPANQGIRYLNELISFEFVCRRCKDYPCVNACVYNALERKDGIITRSKFRCVSCKSCALACPFGTIIYDSIPYISGRCDFCLERLEKEQLPSCAEECPKNAVRYVEEKELEGEKHIEKFGEHLLLKVFNWLKFQDINK